MEKRIRKNSRTVERLKDSKDSKGLKESMIYCCSYGLIGCDYSDRDFKKVDSGEIPGKKREFIRIFKDATPEALWSSYCMGLGLDASDESLKSFKVYIDSPAEDVQADEYTIDGDLIN